MQVLNKDELLAINVFDKDANGNYSIIEFAPSITANDAIECMKCISAAYAECGIKATSDNIDVPQPRINLRGVSTEVIVEVMKYLLSCESIVNASLLLNLYNLVKKYNSFDENFFASEYNWFVDAEQFLNVKRLTSKECADFINRLSIWFLSAMYSMHKVEYTMMDNPEPMPLTYHYFILTSDFFTISALLAKSKVNLDDIKLVDRAYMYIGELSIRTATSFNMMENL